MQIVTMAKKLCLFLILIITGVSVHAQEFDNLLYNYEEKYPQEKIYIHYDKPYYLAGETIWFKAYITSSNQPTTISKTLYAELLDEKGTILEKKVMPIIAGGAAADFTLPAKINDHKYFVRSYTAWMLNFDSSLLYLKPLALITDKVEDIKTLNYKLQIFAEGGNLVAGLPSVITAKAMASNGQPFTVKAKIINSKGEAIGELNSLHDGMGSCNLLPEVNEKYQAVWKDPSGKEVKTDLPEVEINNASFSVNRKDNKTFYTVNRPENVTANLKNFYVVAHMNQQFVYAAVLNLNNKTSVSANFPTDSLPDGIVQLTLFDATKKPIAERIFFVNNQQYYFITDINAVEKNLNPRKKNILQIDVGRTLVSNLSVSITDAELTQPTSHKENIFSELLVSSNIKGYVHNPAYYFNSNNDSAAYYLDMVMRTNGWSRFNWNNILENKYPDTTYKPEDYLSISGRVQSSSNFLMKGKELNGLLGTKVSTGEFFKIALADDGSFNLPGILFYDTAKLYYQINNDKDKKITDRSSFAFNKTYLNINPDTKGLLANFYPPAVPPKEIKIKSITQNKTILKQQDQDAFNKVKTLETVTVQVKEKTAKDLAEKEFTSGFFSGGDSYSFTPENDASANAGQTILSYLQGKVAGLNISTSGEGSLSWRGSETSVFLNEMVTDIQQIQSIPMTEVAYIKVFRPPFFGASFGGSGGAVAVYLKKGANQNNNAGKGMESVKLFGYSLLKEFYNPDYENESPKNNKEDLRTTLYWNPFIIMDKNKRRVIIPFFNNDHTKKFRVVIEGLNEYGQLTSEEKIIE